MLPLTLCAAGLLPLPVSGLASRPHHHTSTHALLRHNETAHARHTEHAPAPAISSERATEIQAALIQRGYLSGEPSGTWDSTTVAAMPAKNGPVPRWKANRASGAAVRVWPAR